MNKALLHNGNFVEGFEMNSANRAFRYGDALFETIRVRDGRVLWYRYHSQRLKSSLKLLKMEAHPDFEHLDKHLNTLLEQNGICEGGRIRLSVYREDGGLYTPVSNTVNYLAEASALPNNDYQLNEKGLTVGYFTEHRKASTQLSRIKTSNALVYILASIFAQKKNFDNVLLLNHSDRVVEATHSNVWIVKEGKLITPGLAEGALYGVMRRGLLNNKIGKSIVEELELSICESTLTKEDIQQADEVFLSNTIQGIQWVEKIGRRKYSSYYSKEIIKIINAFAKADLKLK